MEEVGEDPEGTPCPGGLLTDIMVPGFLASRSPVSTNRSASFGNGTSILV